MKQTLTQIARYGVVGLASNAFGYGLYILLTYFGVGPKLAMTLLYIVGVLQTFVFNKKWSFSFSGEVAPALRRYAAVYATVYVINYFALTLLVDQAGLSHQWVMAGLVLFMALFLFLAQKFWVFRQESSVARSGPI